MKIVNTTCMYVECHRPLEALTHCSDDLFPRPVCSVHLAEWLQEHAGHADVLVEHFTGQPTAN